MSFDRELEIAIRLARQAGDVLLEYYSAPTSVEYKDEREPVTAADRAANTLIVEGLMEAFPDDGILAEETPDTAKRLDLNRLWVVDPMDGTKEFIKRNGEFSVMIGLAVDGVAAAGVVYQPTEDRLLYAARGTGTFIQEKDAAAIRLTVSDTTDTSEMCVAVSRSHRSANIDAVCQALGIAKEVKSGSVGLKVGLICARRCDLYIHPSPQTKQWDVCAPDILISEAGGKMTDLTGQPFKYNREDLYNRNGILATNGTAHDRILARAREVFGAAS